MKRRRNGDSDFDGDLVDPSVGAPEPTTSPSATPNPNAHGQVYVGGGEREARAYVGPTALPSIAAPKATPDKVAISSSVDPRRMQTMKLAPGRPRAPMSPDEPRPGQLTEESGPVGAPSNRYPTSAAQISQRPPKSAMAAATIVRAPPAIPTSKSTGNSSSGPPTIVWVLAVALAALIGAGTALWLRKSNAATTPTPASAPDKPVVPAKP